MSKDATNPKDPTELRAKLESEILQGLWADIRPHLERGAVFVIAQDITLLDAGYAVVSDDVKSIETWLKLGQVARPTPQQMSEWNTNPDREFKFLIAAPYVLVQALSH